MGHFIKSRESGKIYQIRLSEINNGDDGYFDLIWEIFKNNKWTVIETPKHSEYTFSLENEEVGKVNEQMFIDEFL